MIEKRFILGLPGSGKSTVARYIEVLGLDNDRTMTQLQDFTFEVAFENVERLVQDFELNELFRVNLIEFSRDDYRQSLDQVFQLKATKDAFLEIVHLIEEIDNKLKNYEIEKSTNNVIEMVELTAQFVYLLFLISFSISLVKKLIQRFLVIALQILNRVSRSPTPQKKEPPVGGVKVGGKQYDTLVVMLPKYST